jgi:hypothetical protein
VSRLLACTLLVPVVVDMVMDIMVMVVMVMVMEGEFVSFILDF